MGCQGWAPCRSPRSGTDLLASQACTVGRSHLVGLNQSFLMAFLWIDQVVPSSPLCFLISGGEKTQNTSVFRATRGFTERVSVTFHLQWVWKERFPKSRQSFAIVSTHYSTSIDSSHRSITAWQTRLTNCKTMLLKQHVNAKINIKNKNKNGPSYYDTPTICSGNNTYYYALCMNVTSET